MEENFVTPYSTERNYYGVNDKSAEPNGKQLGNKTNLAEEDDEVLDRPLANILPPEFDGVDPKDYFPDFREDKVLRMTRLFASIAKPTMRNQIWWTSRTFRKNHSTTANKEPSISADSSACQQNNEDGSAETAAADLSNFLKIGPDPKPEECEQDEYELLCSNIVKNDNKSAKKADINAADEEDESVPPWRFGPAQIWYDKMGVPANPLNFDYGFRLKKEVKFLGEISEKKQNGAMNGPHLDESAFLPVNLMNWEENIIFDDETARARLIKDYSSGKLPRCGWIPTAQTRTYQSFMESWNNGSFLKMFTGGPMGQQKMVVASVQSMPESSSSRQYSLDAHHSMFPFDDYELENTNWEEKIIWDADNMPSIPEPSILTLSYEDDPKILGIPEEAFESDRQETTKSVERKDDRQYTRRSKLILNQVARRQKQEEEEQMETTIAQIVADKDPFNLSNDDYYLPKGSKKPTQSLVSISSLIQHSLPAQNIHPILFPHHMTPFKLRHFHRIPISRRALQRLLTREAPIHSLTRHIRMAKEQQEQQKSVEGGGSEIFSMRDLKDLTGRDGKLVLFEYSEEFPPYLNQPGMASRIRNYHKRNNNNNQFSKENEAEFEYGERVFAQNMPFLGLLAAGQHLQALENKMYRSPIYRHQLVEHDFLLIRNKLGIFIRPFNALFIAGQECPIEAIPAPNSKQSTNFNNNFLLAYVYRLFWESEDKPRTVRMDDIRFAFPSAIYSEAVLKKRLKHCADLKKPNFEQSQFVLHNDFRLPSKEEIQNMITPESYCAYMSMAAAEQRLKDAGYGEKYFCTAENEDDAEEQTTMDDEIKCAPWNTTKAFIDAQNGKCFFDHQTGSADPTGCGLGFSYVRVSAKIPKAKEETSIPKKLVTGTNADLRKLPLKEAKEICRQNGLLEDEINSLTRWEIIDVIRNLSTDAAKSKSGDFPSLLRFARGNGRAKLTEMQEKNKAYCQRIFDLQNEKLASDKPPEAKYVPGSEVSSSSHHHRKKFTLSSIKDSRQKQAEFEREEQERLDLQKMIHSDVAEPGWSKSSDATKEAVAESFLRDDSKGFSFPDPKSHPNWDDQPQKKLKINRTVFDTEGNEIIQTEIISHPQLIEAYIRIRSTRDDDFIRVYAEQDMDYKEEKRKEKRRKMQEEQRRKKMEEKQQKNFPEEQQTTTKEVSEIIEEPTVPVKPKAKVGRKKRKPSPPPNPNISKLKCSACGQIGHMKTNRNCPLFGKEAPIGIDSATLFPLERVEPSVEDSSKEQHQLESEQPPKEGPICKMEGTRLKISKTLCKHAEKMRRNALRLHIPKHVLNRPTLQTPTSATAKKSLKIGKMAKLRDKKDGAVPSISSDASKEAEVTPLPSIAPGKSGGLTLNISIGPGTSTATVPLPPAPSSAVSISSVSSVGKHHRRGTLDDADYLMGPQKSVHRRRTDPRVSMATILQEIFGELKTVEGADDLMLPVNAKKVPDYYDIVKRPMDLQQIRKNIAENRYDLRHQFLGDLMQILQNSTIYNGKSHAITRAAQHILDLATKRVEENEQKLIRLEKAINPLLDDDDIVGFSHVLQSIVQKCKNLPKSVAFHSKVDLKKFPTYTQVVSRLMDLGTIEQNIKSHKYTTIAAFMHDIEQIHLNSQLFNGPDSPYTEKAAEIVACARQRIEKERGNLVELEANIQKTLGEVDDSASVVSGYSTATELMGVSIPPMSSTAAPTKLEEERDVSAEEFATTSSDFLMEHHPPTVDSTGGGPMFYIGEEDEEMPSGSRIPPDTILQEDLALSNDEMMEEDDQDAVHGEGNWNLLESQMHTSGQLSADLALSESDEDEELQSAKRPKLDEEFFEC